MKTVLDAVNPGDSMRAVLETLGWEPTRARVNEVAQSSQHQPTLTCDLSLEPYDNYILDIAQLSSEQRALLELRLNRGKVKRTSRGISPRQTGLLRSRSPLRSLGSGCTPASSRQARHCFRWIAHSGKV